MAFASASALPPTPLAMEIWANERGAARLNTGLKGSAAAKVLRKRVTNKAITARIEKRLVWLKEEKKVLCLALQVFVGLFERTNRKK